MISAAVIFAGGDRSLPDVAEEIPENALVIAADGGYHRALELGFQVHHLVGDFDSLEVEQLDPAVGVERHPVDKDATDLELAMLLAERHNAERLIIVGGHGGRLDHLLANAALLCRDSFARFDIEWLAGTARLHVIRQATRLHGSVGEPVTLLAVGGIARGIETTGLAWPMTGESLEPGSTRGVSNVLAAPVATVRLQEGVLLSIQPEAMSHPVR